MVRTFSKFCPGEKYESSTYVRLTEENFWDGNYVGKKLDGRGESTGEETIFSRTFLATISDAWKWLMFFGFTTWQL